MGVKAVAGGRSGVRQRQPVRNADGILVTNREHVATVPRSSSYAQMMVLEPGPGHHQVSWTCEPGHIHDPFLLSAAVDGRRMATGGGFAPTRFPKCLEGGRAYQQRGTVVALNLPTRVGGAQNMVTSSRPVAVLPSW